MTDILHAEASTKCQAACPMCSRNIFGQGQTVANQDLTLDALLRADVDIEKLNKIFFCGNLGDPACSTEMFTLCQHIRQLNPSITLGMNTNGGIRKPTWWKTLASYYNQHLDYVVFSIDGLEDTNHIYRRNVMWSKVMENAQAFIDAGGSAHWDMLVFEHNKHQVDECMKLADSMGFTWFRTKETTRWEDYPPEKVGIYPVSTPPPLDYNGTVDCERDRENSLYLDAFGKLWPCCHMASAKPKDIKMQTSEELLTSYKTFDFNICKIACGSRPKRSQWKKEIQLR